MAVDIGTGGTEGVGVLFRELFWSGFPLLKASGHTLDLRAEASERFGDDWLL
jgi:hypothetical protein